MNVFVFFLPTNYTNFLGRRLGEAATYINVPAKDELSITCNTFSGVTAIYLSVITFALEKH
jgi:hypothetical protein